MERIENREDARRVLEDLVRINLVLKILRAELEDVRKCSARYAGYSWFQARGEARAQLRQCCESVEREILEDMREHEAAQKAIRDTIDAVREQTGGRWWFGEYLAYRYDEGLSNDRAAMLLSLSPDYTKRCSEHIYRAFAKAWNDRLRDDGGSGRGVNG